MMLWILTVMSLSGPVLSFKSLSTSASSHYNDQLLKPSDLIGVIDALKHGFHVVITDEANENLFHSSPFLITSLYVTAIPLEKTSIPEFRRIYYREDITGKMIKVTGLPEKSWFLLCVEYHRMSINSMLNQSSGTHCELRRTLDKFGVGSNSPIPDPDVRLEDTRILVDLSVESRFPMRLTTYLTEGSEPIKEFIVEKPMKLHISFSQLQPNSLYGRFCTIYEPLITAYTAMGRAINVRQTNCFAQKDLRTKPLEFPVAEAILGRSDRGLLVESEVVSAASIVFLPKLGLLVVLLNLAVCQLLL